MDKLPMTPKGYKRLRDELRYIRSQRVVIADVILAARELGDLSENAEYHAAKEKQGLMEARIRDLEARLALSEVIDPAKLSGDRVMFGATITMEDVDTGEVVTYSIVGEDEADIKKGLISIASPVGRALINHREGDEVKVRTPGGGRMFEIAEVQFKEID